MIQSDINRGVQELSSPFIFRSLKFKRSFVSIGHFLVPSAFSSCHVDGTISKEAFVLTGVKGGEQILLPRSMTNELPRIHLMNNSCVGGVKIVSVHTLFDSTHGLTYFTIVETQVVD